MPGTVTDQAKGVFNMRTLARLNVFAVALSCCGCDVKCNKPSEAYIKAVGRELQRRFYICLAGPPVIASVAGIPGLPAGHAVLHGLSADQAWRMLMANLPDREKLEPEEVPSIFEFMDMDAPVEDPVRRGEPKPKEGRYAAPPSR